jgi:hypothetical protein
MSSVLVQALSSASALLLKTDPDDLPLPCSLRTSLYMFLVALRTNVV